MFCSTKNFVRIQTCNFTGKKEKCLNYLKMKSILQSGVLFKYFRKLNHFTKKKCPPSLSLSQQWNHHQLLKCLYWHIQNLGEDVHLSSCFDIIKRNRSWKHTIINDLSKDFVCPSATDPVCASQSCHMRQDLFCTPGLYSLIRFFFPKQNNSISKTTSVS